MADLIVEKIFDRKIFTWGQSNLSTENEIRTMYLKALKMADKGGFTALLNFARS
jgi:hypothetical protein